MQKVYHLCAKKYLQSEESLRSADARKNPAKNNELILRRGLKEADIEVLRLRDPR
ncbi:MAG: hypothetical protein HRF42_03390 [Candidatus Brocadia sp.]|jgi:hypothetical protein